MATVGVMKYPTGASTQVCQPSDTNSSCGGSSGSSLWQAGNVGINTFKSVGIGTVNPGVSLDVNGTFRTNGLIQAGTASPLTYKGSITVKGSGIDNTGTYEHTKDTLISYYNQLGALDIMWADNLNQYSQGDYPVTHIIGTNVPQDWNLETYWLMEIWDSTQGRIGLQQYFTMLDPDSNHAMGLAWTYLSGKSIFKSGWADMVDGVYDENGQYKITGGDSADQANWIGYAQQLWNLGIGTNIPNVGYLVDLNGINDSDTCDIGDSFDFGCYFDTNGNMSSKSVQTATEAITVSPTTKTCATSGNVKWYPPEQGSGYKVVVGYASACLGASSSYTFPVAFTNTPACLTTNELSCSLLTTLSTSAVVMTGTTNTGYIFIEGN
jgi:hypothetical protein